FTPGDGAGAVADRPRERRPLGREGVRDLLAGPRRAGRVDDRRRALRGARAGVTRQERKAEAFRALHEGEPFVIPNPWDAGWARAVAGLGFKALASTSSGFAFTLGRLDGDVTLDEVVAHIVTIDRATDLPLSVDLENGYGADPESTARAVTRAAEAGAVGGAARGCESRTGTPRVAVAGARAAA